MSFVHGILAHFVRAVTGTASVCVGSRISMGLSAPLVSKAAVLSLAPPRSRQRWNMFKRGAQRHLEPGIFSELAPTGEGEASAWLQRRAQIGKSVRWLREKHDAKARKKEIESGRFKPVGRRVGGYEFDRGARWQPLGTASQHRR